MAATLYSIELDVVHDDDEPVGDAAASLIDSADTDSAIAFEVTDAEGPGGGWPVVRFTSDDPAAIADLLLAYHNGDASDAMYAAVAGVERIEG